MAEENKSRELLAVKNLAELKRIIKPGTEFLTTAHSNHPDMVGLVRVVSEVQSNAFYSKIKDQPEHKFSTSNDGKGFRTDFEKASDYIFDGATVKVLNRRKQDGSVLFEFQIYDQEMAMKGDEKMNGWPTHEQVQRIKDQYPPGTRIRLNHMEDSQAVPDGTEGTVDMVDDIGQIHMKWDNGRALALVPGEDSFSVVPQKQAQGMTMQMGGLGQ